MSLLAQFKALIAIDNVHPNEEDVCGYVKDQLTEQEVDFVEDAFGNIFAILSAATEDAPTIALNGHVDIAAPLNGREVIEEDGKIRTDGTALLGGDDKTAVAAMLQLAVDVRSGEVSPGYNVQLIFTKGEEAGLLGARNMDYDLFTADDVLVMDWTGPVNSVVTKSPAYVTLDIRFEGVQAHPAEWQHGKNAGASLMKVLGSLRQGEYQPGVTFNIGEVHIGQARNQVPGDARCSAELRSFDGQLVKAAAREIVEQVERRAASDGIIVDINLDDESSAFSLQEDLPIVQRAIGVLGAMGLDPDYVETYGCFDGNVFASHGKNVMVVGSGYYNPHGPEEYVDVDEFTQMYDFVKRLVAQKE